MEVPSKKTGQFITDHPEVKTCLALKHKAKKSERPLSQNKTHND